MRDTLPSTGGVDITEPRYRAVLEADAGALVTEVAERYGVSRQAVHRLPRRSHRRPPALIERRRATRPFGEMRPATGEELIEFEEHFLLRKVALGDCHRH